MVDSARPEPVEGRAGEARGSASSPRADQLQRLPRWARFFDLICLLSFALAGIVAVSGGFRITAGGWRIAVTSPLRLLLWAGATALIRHLAAPRPPIHRDMPARMRKWWAVLARSAVMRTFVAAAEQPLPFGEARLFGTAENASDAPTHLSTDAPTHLCTDAPKHPTVSSIAEWMAVTLGFSVLVAAFTWPQIRRLDSVPDPGDPLFSIWRISWIAHQLAREPSRLFDANIFYPERLTLTYSDSILLPSFVTAPFLWLGLHRVVVYNVLFLSAFVLSGFAMYLLVRALTGRRDAAVVAGVVFTVDPYRYMHYSHLELQMTMWMPLALWALHRTMARGRLLDGVATGLGVALQTLSSMYYGIYFATYAIVVGATLWIARRFPLRPVVSLAAGAALAGVLVAPVASKYLAGLPSQGARDPGTVKDFSAEPRDYLTPPLRNLTYKRWANDTFQERQLFPHIAPLALALVGAWPPMSVATVAYSAAWVLAIEASLGSNGVTFGWLREHVPGYRSLRVPARFSILGGLSVAVLCGYGAARLLRRWPRQTNAVLAVLLAPIMFEALPNIALVPVPPEPPAIYEALANQPQSVIAEFPTPEQIGLTWADTRYMYFSTFHWQRLLNGNSGFWPQSYFDFLHRTIDFPSGATLVYLRERGVQYITWHGAFVDQPRYRVTARRLDDRSDLLELVAVAPWGGSESRLYRLR